ncbi:MAG: AAA family ATPase [Deltaproteobacteria bacterium]|nr:AAA family ATPase [Deltaproteobacteria bacterium]
MAALKSLRICNYKAFADTTFEPDEGGLTILIGNNGSGKTSLWEVLSLLSRLASDWQVRWLEFQFNGRGRNFVGCLPWHQSDREMLIEMTLRGDGRGPSSAANELAYRVGWSANPETGLPELTTEEAVCNGKELLRFDRTTGRYSPDQSSGVRWHFLERNYPLLLSSVGRQVLANTRFAWVKAMFDEVAAWNPHRFRVLDLGKDFGDLDITKGPLDRLTIIGTNLAPLLHAWKEAPDRWPFETLRSRIRLVLDRAGMERADWDVRTEVAGAVAYAFVRFRELAGEGRNGRWFDLAFAPDGFKAFFLLATALLSDSPLILLEEPECHLEPRMLDLVADMMKQAAKGGHHVVATSHSPVLAQHLDPACIRILRSGRFLRVPVEVREGKDLVAAWLTDILDERGEG